MDQQGGTRENTGRPPQNPPQQPEQTPPPAPSIPEYPIYPPPKATAYRFFKTTPAAKSASMAPDPGLVFRTGGVSGVGESRRVPGQPRVRGTFPGPAATSPATTQTSSSSVERAQSARPSATSGSGSDRGVRGTKDNIRSLNKDSHGSSSSPSASTQQHVHPSSTQPSRSPRSQPQSPTSGSGWKWGQPQRPKK